MALSPGRLNLRNSDVQVCGKLFMVMVPRPYCGALKPRHCRGRRGAKMSSLVAEGQRSVLYELRGFADGHAALSVSFWPV